jgi:hypothetical protein
MPKQKEHVISVWILRQTSFLTGTWRGTVTIQINRGDPNAPPPTSGDMT